MNIFQQLALLHAQQEVSSLESLRHKLRLLVRWFYSTANHSFFQEGFSNFRKLTVSILDEVEGFMCDEDILLSELPEEFHDTQLGFVSNYGTILFSGKYVFPVHDVKNNIAGFVGYNATYEKDGGSKYYDSRTAGYLAKSTTVYGMNNLSSYYRSNHIFITEGCICSLVLRMHGLNSVATLGSYLSPYIAEIFRRFESRAIFVVDNDLKGSQFCTQIKRECPKARIIHTTKAKDIDEARLVDVSLLEELRYYTTNFYGIYHNFRIL